LSGSLTETLHSAVTRAIGHEAEAVRSLREYNEKARGHDPAKVAWPASLTIELALRNTPPCELKVHYGYTDEEWAALRYNPVFIKELAEACEAVKQEGVSFRKKAQFQMEAMLETSWRLVHAPGSEVPPNVKADLIKATARWAGYDNREGVGSGAGSMLNIQFNFGE
jgi:hypothetical protein